MGGRRLVLAAAHAEATLAGLSSVVDVMDRPTEDYTRQLLDNSPCIG